MSLPAPLPALDPIPLRVLGALLEKQMSTPEYYPLTLNALVNACNQSSNRDPVMSIDEESVLSALDSLKENELAWEVNAAGSRATKYEHAMRDRFDLSEQEAAVLCELILRGPQTPGELRARTSRLYAFKDLSEVDVALGCLVEAETPLARALPRQPGSREIRYGHLLGSASDPRETQPVRMAGGDPRETRPISFVPAAAVSELQVLRDDMTALKTEVDELKELLSSLRKSLPQRD